MSIEMLESGKVATETDHPSGLVGRLLFIDLVRIGSLVMIISYHFNLELIRLAPSVRAIFSTLIWAQPVGDVGVTLFIMLSGASLMLNSRREEAFLTFLRRRILSIFPSYWTAYVAVTVVLFFVRGSLQGNGQYWQIPLTIVGLDGFLFSLTHSWYYLIGEWFLGFILLTYLFFPFLAKIARKVPVFSFAGVLIFSLLAAYICRDISWLPTLHNPLVRLPDFLFGMIYASYRLDKKWWCAVGGIAIVVITPPLTHTLPTEVSSVMLGAGIIAVAGAICNFVRFAPYIQDAISRFAALSFLSFLVHHWVVYLSIPRFNTVSMSRSNLYFLFGMNLAISFLIAKYLEKPAGVIRRIMTPARAARGQPG